MSTLKLSLVGFSLRLALLLVVMVNVLFLARTLGPQRFGEYFLFLRVVSVLAVLADLGLSQSANAFFGRHMEWRGSIHRVILKFVPIFWLVTTAIAGFTLWALSDVLLPNLAGRLIVLGFCCASAFAIRKPLEQHDARDGKDLAGEFGSGGNVRRFFNADNNICGSALRGGYGGGHNLLVGNGTSVCDHAHDGVAPQRRRNNR